MKRFFYLFLSIGLLLSSALFFLSWEKSDRLNSLAEISLLIEDKNGTQSITLWQDGGTYYAFLPSYCALTDVHFPQYEKNDIAVDQHFVDDFSSFSLNTPYSFALYDNKATLLEQAQICFLQSEHLPAIYIETQSGSMKQIHADRTIKEAGSFTLIEEDGTYNYQGTLDYIKGRGNASWLYDKRPYNLKLTEATPLLDMPQGQTWCLIANYLDASSLRNALVYSFARDILQMSDTPNTRYVDLYLNGEYTGLYQLCEPIEVAETRLAITNLDQANQIANERDLTSFAPFTTMEPLAQKGFELSNNPSDITGGYLLEMDLQERYELENTCFQTEQKQTVVVKSPEFASREEMAYISNYVNEFEQALLAKDGYNDAGHSYLDYIDLTSWCKKYFVEEFFENLDSGLTSQYFYKPAADHEQRSVLYAGPVWDYDWSCGNGDFSVRIIKNLHAAQTYNTKFYYSYWYGALNEKIAFQQELKNIYQEIYPKTNAYLQNTLTELCSEIAASWELDKLRWAHSEKNINTVQFDTLAEHSAYIYTFLTKRAEFLYDVWCHNTTYYTLMCDTQLDSRYWYYSLKPNESITLPVPTLDGYTFLGWCTADGQAFNGKISEDTTIYAQWQKQE
ncbi:MAG: CotH kinase family protein [Peptococcaceae bacterium]|nr:CotH kinase family protein [Peptococcaceae bacterium]